MYPLAQKDSIGIFSINVHNERMSFSETYRTIQYGWKTLCPKVTCHYFRHIRNIHRINFPYFFRQELWTWTKLCSCIGSICFLISDTLLGFHYFHTPLPYSQVCIRWFLYIYGIVMYHFSQYDSLLLSTRLFVNPSRCFSLFRFL